VYMATLNLRGFPVELLWSLKVKAAQRGIPLREYCVEVLGGAVYVETPLGPGAHDDGILSAAMAGKVGKREGIQDRGSKERGVAVRGFVHKVAQAKRQGESAVRVGVERVDEESQSGPVAESVRDEEAVAELSDEDLEPEPPKVVCVACEGKLDPFKDKMVCSDAGCGMRGVAQKGRKV
jgi:hypothetical protein